MVVKIMLSKQGKNKGKYAAVVDDCDSDLLSRKWHVHMKRYSNYARHAGTAMHSIILGRKLGRKLTNTEVCDHADGDGLNNTRSNLRLATLSQNRMNSRKGKRNKTGYKGVSWITKNKKYRAQICKDRKVIYLGEFDTALEAYDVYCEAAKSIHGEFHNIDDT